MRQNRKSEEILYREFYWRSTEVIQFLEFFQFFHVCIISREEYQNFLTFHIPKRNLKWSEIFETIEEAKKSLDIFDYSLRQTTLEQVFLHLVKEANKNWQLRKPDEWKKKRSVWALKTEINFFEFTFLLISISCKKLIFMAYSLIQLWNIDI